MASAPPMERTRPAWGKNVPLLRVRGRRRLTIRREAKLLDLVNMAAPIRVLIIDDSNDILFILKTELEHLGYTVDIAADPMEGLRVAEARSPDVIISDIGLPGVDGFELLKRIRQRPGLASAPVIALSGLDSEDDAACMQSHGFSGRLVKPVDGATVAALIQSVIPRRRKRV